MKTLILVLVLSCVSVSAFAAAPTNEELLTARIQADESELAYLQKVLARMQENEKVLAEYWAAWTAPYTAGLKSPKKP